MPTITSYLTVDGEILAQTQGGVTRDYLPDSLGSTVALLDSSQTKTDTVSYWPYGEERTRTGTNATPFRYVGTLGYYADQTNQRTYIRARSYRSNLARWQTVDPVWPFEPSYRYAKDQVVSAIDRDGQTPETLKGGSIFVPPANQPCTFSGLSSIGLKCAGAGDCLDNTNEYGNSFNKSGNKLDRCASCVSAAICEAIAAGNVGGPLTGLPGSILGPSLAAATACQNNCMIQYWREKKTPLWQQAINVCRTSGQSSAACCQASVRAEQNGYDQCAPKCFPPLGLIPTPIRIMFALDVLHCCN